jgi:ABC-2 type transport system permease protein
MTIFRIAARETVSYFRSSIGWVAIALYLLLSGFWIAFAALRPGEPATLRAFFGVSQWILLIVAPAISMRLIADEKRTGTFEALITAPVSDWQIVVGKYLGAVAFFIAMLLPTLAYVGLLELVSDPDYGPILAGYLGLILVGMLYLSVGLLTSAITENQIVSLLATVFFFILLELLSTTGGRWLGPPFDEALFPLSIFLRIADLAKGVIDTAHIAVFLAASAWFVVLTVVVVESRRWR